jgi:hypothetical protein
MLAHTNLQSGAANDFAPPPRPVTPVERIFVGVGRLVVQTPAQSHEYKKVAGSSDAAMTRDTTAV